jgi:hypothetical protein
MMHPLIDFFAKPRLKGGALLKTVTALLKVLSENPDIVYLLEESSGETLLVIKEDGRTKSAFVLGGGSVMTFASEEEAVKNAVDIQYAIKIEKEAWGNIMEGMNESGTPFVEGAKVAQEELRSGRLSISPKPKPMQLFLSMDVEEVVLKFSPAFGISPGEEKVWLLPWYLTKTIFNFSFLFLYRKLSGRHI